MENSPFERVVSPPWYEPLFEFVVASPVIDLAFSHCWPPVTTTIYCLVERELNTGNSFAIASVTVYFISFQASIEFYYTFKNKRFAKSCVFSIYLVQHIACSFQRDVKLGILTTNCLHVHKYCNGAFSGQYASHRRWVVVCVLLVCPHIIFSSLCNKLLLHFTCD